MARPETLLQGCYAYAPCRQDTSPHPTPVAIDACCCPCANAIRIVCGRRLCPSMCVHVGEVDPVRVSPCFPACEAYSTHGCILKEVTQYFSSSNKNLDEIWRRAIRRHGLVALRSRIFTRRRESAFAKNAGFTMPLYTFGTLQGRSRKELEQRSTNSEIRGRRTGKQ